MKFIKVRSVNKKTSVIYNLKELRFLNFLPGRDGEAVYAEAIFYFRDHGVDASPELMNSFNIFLQSEERLFILDESSNEE